MRLKMRGQSTLEYSFLIAVVALSVVAMHGYFQRAAQDRMRSYAKNLTSSRMSELFQFKLNPAVTVNKGNGPGLDFTKHKPGVNDFAYDPEKTSGSQKTTTKIHETSVVKDQKIDTTINLTETLNIQETIAP